MNQDRLTADDHEGYVEWVGEGLAAFADCRGKLGTYPVTLDGNAAGELLCQLQVRQPTYKRYRSMSLLTTVLGACLLSNTYDRLVLDPLSL